MTYISARQHYTRAPGCYRVRCADDAPSGAPKGKLFLYLCVFPDALKVGVSASVSVRIRTHEAARKERIEGCYLIRLDAAEARRRERDITHALGARMPGKAYRCSEWLERSVLGLATFFMRQPTAVADYWDLEVAKRDIENHGHDPRFKLIEPHRWETESDAEAAA